MISLEDRCLWFGVSRSQRVEERRRGLGDAGTGRYERIGCYRCDGYDATCAKYMTFDDTLRAAQRPMTYFWVRNITKEGKE